ncbi:ribosome silencing factor [Inmirania thermothiophila]|uniref:Ribosomal silencing factor RsfS n=1 Tax=Inmirania thermothiophila TaxID=1750597 RepID=A0A3N1YBW0_9GAMM|nr:ribosome silencing factor [Inmirania thermothiophila]ROR34867.1 ribosome-associated protein [Inmirania thermothiophila]
MEPERLAELVERALDDMKAEDVRVLDVRDRTAITDFMVIASGTSQRHVRALAQEVAFQAKKAGQPPLGVEGEQAAEWVLVDLGAVVVHVMQPRVRAFYNLEKLWSTPAEGPAGGEGGG